MILAGKDGFTIDDVTEIMLHIEKSTAEEACNYLIELGYSDTFYDQASSRTIEEFSWQVDLAGHSLRLAETFDGITFRGGPRGDTWLTLNLQCLLEDHVAQCICVHGSEIVARTLGVDL